MRGRWLMNNNYLDWNNVVLIYAGIMADYDCLMNCDDVQVCDDFCRRAGYLGGMCSSPLLLCCCKKPWNTITMLLYFDPTTQLRFQYETNFSLLPFPYE